MNDNLHKMAANEKTILAKELANANKVEIFQKSLQGFHWDYRKKQNISSMLQSSVFKHKLDSQKIVFLEQKLEQLQVLIMNVLSGKRAVSCYDLDTFICIDTVMSRLELKDDIHHLQVMEIKNRKSFYTSYKTI